MKEAYLHKNLGGVTLRRIAQANKIIEEYQGQGFILTVRQIYYQFVARNLTDKNNIRAYKLIANSIEKGRMNGLIDWFSIEDRTRFLRGNTNWGSPPDFFRGIGSEYNLDSRLDQDYLIEVWIEKDALLGIISGVCRKFDIDYFSCRGYVSLSAMWRAARRFINDHRKVVILHLGDHDPSGVQMTDDIQNRLNTFGCTNVKVKRIALNFDQVKKYNPPPNFAKLTDTRTNNYIEKYGEQCWELDALSPETIVNLIEKHVNKLTDQNKLEKRLKLQDEQRDGVELELNDIADIWENEH